MSGELLRSEELEDECDQLEPDDVTVTFLFRGFKNFRPNLEGGLRLLILLFTLKDEEEDGEEVGEEEEEEDREYAENAEHEDVSELDISIRLLILSISDDFGLDNSIADSESSSG